MPACAPGEAPRSQSSSRTPSSLSTSSGLPRMGSAPPSPTSSLPASTAAQHLLRSPDASSQVHVLVNVNVKHHHHHNGRSGAAQDREQNDTDSDPDYGTDEDGDTDVESTAHSLDDNRQGMFINDEQRAWDDSDEDEPQVLAVEHELDQGYRSSSSRGPPKAHASHSRDRRSRRHGTPDLMPLPIPFSLSSQQRRSCWRFLTNPPTQNSLSAPAVTLNLFAGSLHPAVLLSMPYYFERTGLVLGLVGLLGVGFLSGVGGGLWIVLARYVGRNDEEDDPEETMSRADHASRKRAKKIANYGEGGNMTTLEGVTGAALGRHTLWKRTLGRTISGVLLAAYATGTAFLAYFAMADLLLQVFLHYSPRGVPTHDRLFVTAVVGGLLTAPLVIFPLAKRTLIRISTACAVVFYPVLIAALLVKIYTMDLDTPLPPFQAQGPNAQPLNPPSIWAPYSLLPVLTLSSSPLQIIQHNRSLRRIGMSRSNTKAFMAAQAGQVFLVAGFGVAFGIGVGTQGMGKRLGIALAHPNLMASLPNDDHLFNTARVCFVLLLATHFALCLVTARSSWGRLLRLYHLNPFRYRRGQGAGESGEPAAPTTTNATPSDSRQSAASRRSSAASRSASGRASQTSPQRSSPAVPTFPQPGSFPSPRRKLPRQWNRLSRNALGGLILWCFCASTAYLSGVGGLRRSRNEKAGEEARFVRSAEIVGLLGAVVGFILPGLVWVVLFHVRRPRAILLAGSLGQQVAAVAQELGSRAGAWLRGLSVARRERLERERRRRAAAGPGGGSGSSYFSRAAGRIEEEERRGLLTEEGRPEVNGEEDSDEGDQARSAAPERQRKAQQVNMPRLISSPPQAARSALPRFTASASRAVNNNNDDEEGEESGASMGEQERARSPDPLAVLLAQKERQLQRRRRGRRLYQDLLVCVAVLPFGMALVVLGAIELVRGGY
ncbi:unnamed protein product [Tilletia laevis]|uniref:Amino acid transporter transmembrane domain-containing protein n=4 Tax=Tilletia TaxID=13289 RepID=A0A8X7MUI5_9BASI|nr:hypothetical protein CF336_g3576 [Tilletia laevis]KAE8194487.1 hypothetical protein CF328_g4732 [Tilletia controversa]KAE8258306.1 hypothetical protein A4X03_0g4424 [Tilletia caries]KAE8248005.1 hypothetical protein A4X06_0g4029 [Tilletia controversa]CAD6890855.1 unnamed protein product [Tilletia caries]